MMLLIGVVLYFVNNLARAQAGLAGRRDQQTVTASAVSRGGA